MGYTGTRHLALDETTLKTVILHGLKSFNLDIVLYRLRVMVSGTICGKFLVMVCSCSW